MNIYFLNECVSRCYMYMKFLFSKTYVRFTKFIKMSTVIKTVKAKGDWHTPTQRQYALLSVWQRLVAEEIDLEAIAAQPDITYYNRPFKQDVQCEYDIRFNFSLDFDPKAHRCDRHNLDVVRANVHKEENQRIVPIICSQNYGHKRYNLEGPTLISHKRLRVMDEIYRRFGINVKPSKKLPMDYEVPKL